MTNDLIPYGNIVFEQNGEVFTNSLLVADTFGKHHKHVLQAIDNLECSDEFSRSNFRPSNYEDAKGEKRRAFEMTLSGYMFLAMGFTGREAASVKVALIQEFNELREGIRSVSVIPETRLHSKRLDKDIASYEMTNDLTISDPVVFERDGELRTNSLKVAERFKSNTVMSCERLITLNVRRNFVSRNFGCTLIYWTLKAKIAALSR